MAAVIAPARCGRPAQRVALVLLDDIFVGPSPNLDRMDLMVVSDPGIRRAIASKVARAGSP